jgi:hypothetical protein
MGRPEVSTGPRPPGKRCQSLLPGGFLFLVNPAAGPNQLFGRWFEFSFSFNEPG